MRLEGIARIAHQINRALRMGMGEDGGPDWFAASAELRAGIVAGVKFHIDNPQASPSDSHKAWLNHKLAAGWAYGPVKSEALKVHPCMVPFDKLPKDQQAKDWVFREVVHMVLPTFKHMVEIEEESQQQQTGALLYITAMVKRFGGETGIVRLTDDDMREALDYELGRHDEEGGGLILKVQPAPEDEDAMAVGGH